MPSMPPVFTLAAEQIGNNPNVVFDNVGPYSRLPDRRVLKSSPGYNIDLRLLYHQGLLCQ